MAEGTLDELGEDEVTALELLIDESGGTDESNEDEDNQELPESAEELKALVIEQREKIAKRNKSLKKAKQAQHRTQDEATTLQSQFEALEQKVNGIGKPNVEAENLAKEEQEWRDRVEDDPSKVTEYMDWKNGQMVNNLSAYLAPKLTEIEAKFDALRSETDPEKLEYKAEIAQLKATSEFADLDESTLLTVAKALKKKTVGGRGTIGGKRAVVTTKSKQDEMTDEIRRKMGFNT